MKYGVQEAQILPGSTLFLYTDGLTEAKNKDRRQFGLQRMEEVLGRCALEGTSPQQLLETMGSEVRLFVGDAEQSDDLTMLALRYTPGQRGNRLEETLVMKNDTGEISRLGNFMKDISEKLAISGPLAGQLRLAVEEAVVNAMEYAYPAGTVGEVTLHAESDGNNLLFTLSDNGTPFDPTTVAQADTDLSAEDRPIGGLGILLVRELMDEVRYIRREDRNILTMTKHLKP